MTLEELNKQTGDLKDAILRLCKYADDDDIIINAILGAYVEVCSKGLRLNPKETLMICHAYLHVLSNPMSQKEMKSFLDNLIKR